MLSKEQNEMLTRVGPGTPMGELMRRYWIPAAFSAKIAERDGPPQRVRLLGENLVLFRDTQGRLGLLDERCPHRTASLFFGRNEESGLRCIYHGIKFDVNGHCLDLPCLPPTPETTMQRLKNSMKVKSYPCIERGGVVWTYMGPPELKPDFPDLEWTMLPESHLYASRHIQECNWLQALEGGFDATHLTFLHGGATDPTRQIVPSFYEVVPTDFGFLVGTGRDLGKDDNIYWNINVMMMPFHKIISSTIHGAHVWVPIDDDNTMLYSVDFHPYRALTEEDLARSKAGELIHTINIPGTDHAVANKSNDYLIDRKAQASGESYSGMKGLAVEDCGIQESMGAIADRSLENLLICDTAIAKIRRLLLQTLRDHAEGKPLPGMDAASYRVRSTRCYAPKGASFADTMNDRVRVAAQAAE